MCYTISMPSAKEIFESQRKLAEMKSALSALQNELYEYANKGQGGTLCDPLEISENSPQVIELKAAVAKAESAMTASHDEIGGKVYRVPAENYSNFENKVAKLNRRAVKLGCPEITYYIGETEEEIRKVTGPGGVQAKRLFVWNYVVLSGSTPMVPGYQFIAALDHTVQSQPGDPVIIKQVPGIEEELDLSDYRHADARCEHCGKLRSRNTTYLVEERNTGKVSKVGSSCLKDFTGANDPHRVAKFLEVLIEFEEETNEEGEDYSHGRQAEEVLTFLTHVAACIRARGWTPKSYGGYPTVNQAEDNIWQYGKTDKKGNPIYVALEDKDTETAKAAIEWAKGLEGQNDFEHNLKTMAGLEYMPKKGKGIVAYIVQGYVKDDTKCREREAEERRKADAEPVKEGRQTITGAVIKVYDKEYGYDIVHKMTVIDDRGFTVNGSVPSNIFPVEKGDRVNFSATIEPKEGDEHYGWYKRPTKASVI